LTGFTLLQLASRSIPPVSAVFGIGEQRFKFEGLIDLGSLGLEDINGMVAAMGDLDGEQLQGARYIRVED
jgi:integrin alpha FG-GAP repeat containing protein 1